MNNPIILGVSAEPGSFSEQAARDRIKKNNLHATLRYLTDNDLHGAILQKPHKIYNNDKRRMQALAQWIKTK